MLIDYKKNIWIVWIPYFWWQKKMQNGTFEVEERIFKLLWFFLSTNNQDTL